MSLAVTKKRKMNAKKLSILDLNNDCMLEVMKCIIASCELQESPDNPSKYVDMENFARTDDSIKELLRTYYKEVYYHRELTVVATVLALTIDFAQLQSTIANKNEGDAYWKLYAKALRRNNVIRTARLTLDPVSSYTEFPKHFQIIKGALENKRSLIELGLTLNGYSLDHLNNFKYLSKLQLDLRISSESLVSICQSAPRLSVLEIMSTEIEGRLSDIVPHCRYLDRLTFVPKPNIDGSEYAPLVQLPHLIEITIHGAYKNGSLLPMFQAMKDWQRAQTFPLTVNFTDVLPVSSSVTMARISLIRFLSNSLDVHCSDRVELKTSYDFLEISRDTRPIEESLASMIVTAASFEIDWLWKGLTLQGCSIWAINSFISVLKLFNINNLTVAFIDDYEIEEIVLPKLFESMIPDGLFALKSICINEADEFSSQMPIIDQLATRELVRIKSITFLKCSFSDWESMEFLSELSNLQTLDIEILERKFEKVYAKALCNLLDTCQVYSFIRCCDWIIEFKKNETIPDLSSHINTLKIFDLQKKKSLNVLFEALANRMFRANEELVISHSYLNFKDIHKVSEIKTLKPCHKWIPGKSLRTNGNEGISKASMPKT